MNKLTNISRFAAFGAKILMVLAAIIMTISVILMVFAAVDPDLVTVAVTTAGINNVNLDDIDVRAVAVVTSVGILAMGLLGMAALYYTDRLFTNIYKNNTPFTSDNARCLEMLAILTVIFTVAMIIFDVSMLQVLDAEYYQSFGVGIFPLFLALLIYLLSLVFKHGATLQKESDETL